MKKTSSQKKIKTIFTLFAFLFFTSIPPSLHASITRHSNCNTTGGTNPTDGSNCGSGLICDRAMRVCVYPDESACGNGFACPIGMSCYKNYGNSGTQSVIKAREGTSGYGECHPSLNSSIETNAINQIMCRAYSFLTGTTGRIFATLTLIGYGSTFIGGNIEISKIITLIAGMALWFGGPSIVGIFLGRGVICAED